jgi:hypothetical protein
MLMSKRSGEHLHPPAGRELEVALWFLRGVLAADRQGMLVGGRMRSGEKLATLVLSGSPEDPAVALEWRDLPGREPEAGDRPTWLPDRARLEGLPILDETWLVGLPVVPARIAESNEIMRVLLVMEAERHLMLSTQPMTAFRAEYAAAEHLLEVFFGSNEAGVEGIPAEIQVTDQPLHELLAPELRRLGVRCRYLDSVPALLQEAVDSLRQYLGEPPAGPASGAKGLDRPLLAETPGGELRLREPAASDPASASDPGPPPRDLGAPPGRPASAPEPRRWSRIPENDDIGAWRTVNRQLSTIAMSSMPDGLGGDRRLLARYFGGEQAAREVLQDPELSAFAVSALSEWLWIDHRPGGRGSTHAEQMLAGEVEGVSLVPPERILLEAMSEAPVSLYVVRSVEPGRSLVLEDLLRGGRLEVRDRALSETARVEMAVAARVYPVGDPVGGTHFISGLGPPLSPFQIGGAQQLLDDLGLETTSKALRRGAHLFGRIWHWRQELPEIPLLRTTDGEDMELHHGTFRARHPAKAWQALAAQPELEPGDDDQVLIWLEPGGSASGPKIIAHLRLDGYRIDVETNSAARWERVRARLEGLDRVTLDDHESQSVQEALAAFKEVEESGTGEAEAVSDSASHTDLPVDLADPEILEAIREELRERQLAWLDEPVPALGGETPRDAVRTAAGRRRVQQMIRAMPAVSLGEGVPPIEPPRDELRRRLGIPEE